MTKIERKLLLINGLLGTALTLLVLGLDWGGQLRALENWFYDRRALHCQFFAKPTSDRLVFLDIDDNAIDTIGRWPWDRGKMTGLIDEIADAGPALIFLDILYPEPQPAMEEAQPDGSRRMVEQDPPMAAALHRAANVVVPIALDFDGALRKKVPGAQAMVDLLAQNLEQTPEELAAALAQQGFHESAKPSVFDSRFIAARRLAMYRRVQHELNSAPDISLLDLRHRLLPRSDPRVVSSPLLRLLAQEHEKAVKLLPMRRFSRLPVPGDPPLLQIHDELAPLAMFTSQAGGSGFVNYESDADGVIRRIPLFVEHRGRIIPQVGLAIACKVLGVDPNDLRLTENRIVIPRRQGDIQIPVSVRRLEAAGFQIGTTFDIPYLGGDQWETMFDPHHKTARQHVPIKMVWQVGQTRGLIANNNATADRALLLLTSRLVGQDEAAQLQKRKLDPADAETRAKDIHAMLNRLAENIALYTGALTPTEKTELADLKYEQGGLQTILKENRQLTGQLQTQRAELKTLLGNKAVFVGSIATATADDVKPTAIHGKCPGMVIHGVIANGILTGELWREAPFWLRHVLTLLMGLATTTFVLRLTTTKAALATIALAASYLLVNGIVLFDYFNIILGVTGPIVAILVTWLSCELVEILVEKAERRRITRRFRSYVDPALVRYVIEHPEQDVMSGQEREMTVVFTDLQGFTTISEALREKVVPLLNQYLGMMVTIIRRHNGYVNKFLGDGIMFFYNAPWDNPNHAVDAVATVMDMQEAMVDFNASLKERGLPALIMRAGIVTGNMIVGDAGSKDGSDYTVIGDNVNLAARLESANKATDTRVMMTARTRELLDGRFLVRPTARLQVKGKTEGVDTCELVARADQAGDARHRYIQLGKAVFEAFVNADFAACLIAVEQSETEFGKTKLTAAYRELSEQYLRTPPDASFKGEIVLHEK